MSANGSDGQQQQQMHMGGQQMQHPQMHPQMRPQGVIRQTIPVHMSQGQNLIRMPRPQVSGGQMGQPVHVLQQGVMQQPQTQGMLNDGSHGIPVGMVDQTRPVVTSYGPQGTTHMQSVSMYPVAAPGQMRRRNGVQQPFYGQQVRIGAPGGVQQPMTGSAPIRLIPSGNNAGGNVSQGMHGMVSQPNQVPQQQQQQMGHPPQQQQPQQHFMSGGAESGPQTQVPPTQAQVQQQQQQRMMVSQQQQQQPRPVVSAVGGQGMKIIPTGQQQQPQTMIAQGPGVRGSMPQSQMQQQPTQQMAAENTPRTMQPMQNSPQSLKPEQQQQFLQIVENAMKQMSQTHPDADLKNYHSLKNAILTGQIQRNLPAVEKIIQLLANDPTYLTRQKIIQPQLQGSGGMVSEETRQKLVQKRGLQNQTGIRVSGPNPSSSSSSLNSLLSQPADHLGGGPVGGPYNAAAMSARTPQMSHQQQQMSIATAELLNENPMDEFNAAMDKIAEDMAILRRKMGPERAAQIDNEICEIARQTLEKSGHLLPRDVLPVPKPERGPYLNTADMVIGGAARLAEFEEIRARKRPKYEEWPIQVSEEDQLVSNGKSTSDSDLTFDDLNSHLQLELEVIGKNVPEVKVTIVHPEPDVEAKEERELGEYPDMEEMKKYDKVHDADEWNRGLHLRLDFDSKCLPCGVPPLYVCVPPSYLVTKNVIWMLRKSDFATPQPLSDSFYNECEVTKFRKVSTNQITQYLDTYRIVQRKNRQPISLYNISEIWAKGVFKSVIDFKKVPKFGL